MKRLLLVFCCLMAFNVYASKLNNVIVHGVSKEIEQNIQDRLFELYKNKPIEQDALDDLQLQVTKALYPYGYFKPKISISLGGKTPVVTIHIEPGPLLRITRLNITLTGAGAQNAELKKTVNTLPISVGKPLTTLSYEAAKNKLSEVALQEGYLYAGFDTAKVLIDPTRYTAEITLSFHTGPQYYFGPVRFKSHYIDSDLLHRYVPFKPGEIYSTEKILQLNKNLMSSGYYRSVNVNPLLHKGRYVPTEISLEPVDRINYTIGAGYGTDTGARGRFGLNVTPVNSSGHTFNLMTQGSFQENALQGQYIIPGKNPLTDHYNINGGFTNLSYNVGNSNAALIGVAQQHAVPNYQRTLSINALNDHYKYIGLPRNEVSLVFPKAVFTWKQVSDPLFSPSGYNVTVYGLGASKALLSQVNLAQIAINAKAAVTVDMIKTRFYVHAIEGLTQFNEINELPFSLALLLGGAENLKGYSFNSIGPGRVTQYVGFEIQKEVFSKWYALGFYDRGAVYDPSLKTTLVDAGIGIMWVSPVGPIKIEVAQALTPRLHQLPNYGPKLVINMGPDL